MAYGPSIPDTERRRYVFGRGFLLSTSIGTEIFTNSKQNIWKQKIKHENRKSWMDEHTKSDVSNNNMINKDHEIILYECNCVLPIDR